MAEKKKHHPFTHSHVEWHDDNSATVHHVHRDGPHKDVKGAAASHDDAMDHIMDHTSEPNEGEQEANAGVHGVPAEQAGPAGLPAGAAPAADAASGAAA